MCVSDLVILKILLSHNIKLFADIFNCSQTDNFLIQIMPCSCRNYVVQGNQDGDLCSRGNFIMLSYLHCFYFDDSTMFLSCMHGYF